MPSINGDVNLIRTKAYLVSPNQLHIPNLPCVLHHTIVEHAPRRARRKTQPKEEFAVVAVAGCETKQITLVGLTQIPTYLPTLVAHLSLFRDSQDSEQVDISHLIYDIFSTSQKVEHHIDLATALRRPR